MASTMRPKAKSLSATHAAGVGEPLLVPLVWSSGRQMKTRPGNEPEASNSLNSRMKKSAPKLIGHRHFPTDIVGGHDRFERFHHGITGKDDLIACPFPGPIAGQKVGITLAFWIAPLHIGSGKLAIIALGNTVGGGVIP